MGSPLHLAGGGEVFIYPKDDHAPATFTVLNFPSTTSTTPSTSSRAPASVRALRGMEQDEKGINRGEGPEIAWFKDPAGNILSVLVIE